MMHMNVFPIKAPDGSQIQIPEYVDEKNDVYLNLKSNCEIRYYYDHYGYVVIRNLIPKELCQQAHKAFIKEIKPYGGYIYRQATANPERHKFTEYGYMENSILNVQDINSKKFNEFRMSGIQILTHKNMLDATITLLGEKGKLVQSMYFEGNPATWAHQDTYYLDSVNIGHMTAAWIAVEDINPGAGRFFIYPGSHKIDMQKNGGDFDIAFNHDRYKRLVIDVINKCGLTCKAPALRQGDVLFWASKTIHGSLPTVQAQYSRSSFTAHYIPQSDRFLQFQSRIKPLKLTEINSMLVHQPKDQNILKNQVILYTETTFPKAFQMLKKIAMKAVTR